MAGVCLNADVRVRGARFELAPGRPEELSSHLLDPKSYNTGLRTSYLPLSREIERDVSSRSTCSHGIVGSCTSGEEANLYPRWRARIKTREIGTNLFNTSMSTFLGYTI